MYNLRILGAVVIIAGAAYLLYALTKDDGSAPVAVSPETTKDSPAPAPVETAPTPAGSTGAAEGKAAESGQQASVGGDGQTSSPAPESAAVSEAPTPTPPIFEILRVDPDGNAVFAGRAAPGARIEFRSGDRVLGETHADRNGQWVFLPETPLGPGEHVITAFVVDGSGTDVAGAEAVVIVIPEPGRDIAGNVLSADRAAGDRTPLVMVVPHGDADAAPPRIAQIPGPSAAGAGSERGEAGPVAPAGTVIRVFPESGSAAGGDGLPLDTIDYDEAGDAVLSGRAEPGRTIQVFIDDKLDGTVEATEDGNWVLLSKLPDYVEQHKVSIRQLDESGTVVKSIDVPFLRARPFADLTDGLVVVVQPGNSLWRISRRILGMGVRYTEIFQANADQIRNPNLVFPGQVLGLPQTE